MGYAGLHKRQILPEECDAPARQLFHFFNSRPVLEFLEGLTTIQGLIPDPYFMGGGYHETGRGGKLGIHADFRINDQLHLHRRLNVIVYLNERWQPEWGGALELWDREMKEKRREVMPVFNRCVIFATTATAFHGVPHVRCPAGRSRKSLALYYFEDEGQPRPIRPTHYVPRPGDRPTTRLLIRLDRLLLHAYALLKRYTPFGDRLISRLLRKL